MPARLHALARSAAIVLVVLCASPALAQPGEEAGAVTLRDGASRLPILIAAEVALHSADMLTTVHNLRAGHAREGNPMLAPFSGRPLALVAVSGAVNVLQVYTIAKLRPRHPRLAVAWALILIGTEAYAVTNNVRVAGQAHRARQ